MKTFEERFTAWVDGQLTGDALAAFERELAAHPEAAAERASAHKLGELLRTYAAAPALANADFFSLQLRQRLEAERPRRQSASRREPGGFFWSLSRLAWAGAFCLVVATVLFKALISSTPGTDKSNYFAQVVESWPSDPSISATTVYSPEDNVTVVWLDGLDYIPASYELH